jgi:hypothetical protein
MRIKTICPNPACGKRLSIKASYAGKTVKCPACGNSFPVVTNADCEAEIVYAAPIKPVAVWFDATGELEARRSDERSAETSHECARLLSARQNVAKTVWASRLKKAGIVGVAGVLFVALGISFTLAETGGRTQRSRILEEIGLVCVANSAVLTILGVAVALSGYWDADRPERKGIGGYLLFPGLGLSISTINQLGYLLASISAVTSGNQRIVGISRFEVLSNALILGLTVLAVVVFFRKLPIAPKTIIGLLFLCVGFRLVDCVWATAIAGEPLGIRELGAQITVAAIWIPYFLISKRVHATFVARTADVQSERASALPSRERSLLPSPEGCTQLRRCFNCGGDLTNEPAIQGILGLLCFPCRYKIDRQGGEQFVAAYGEHVNQVPAWKAGYGKPWQVFQGVRPFIEKSAWTPIVVLAIVCFSAACLFAIIDSVFEVEVGWPVNPGTLLILAVLILAIYLIGGIGDISQAATKDSSPPLSAVRSKDLDALESNPEIVLDPSCTMDGEPDCVYHRASYPPDWNKRSKKCLERDGHRCRICGATDPLRVCHVKPVAYGGTHSLQNLITLCDSCHAGLAYWKHLAWDDKVVSRFWAAVRGRELKIALYGLGAIVFGIFSVTVWPTLYRYDRVGVAGNEYPVRTHRVTGKTEWLIPTRGGWIEISKESTSNSPSSRKR